MLGMSLDEVIKETIEGMKTEAEAIGLKVIYKILINNIKKPRELNL